MLAKQRKILEKELNQIISKIQDLNIRREEVTKRVKELEDIISSNDRYCDAKEDLKSAWITYPICGILLDIIFYLLFPEELLISSEIKLEVMEIVIPIICLIMSVGSSINPLYKMSKNEKLSKNQEEETKAELSLKDDLIKTINKQITNLESRKESYKNDIKYIDELPKRISRILDISEKLTYQSTLKPSIEDILISEFNDYLSESVDYSKVHLDVIPDIKEYKLKAPK